MSGTCDDREHFIVSFKDSFEMERLVHKLRWLFAHYLYFKTKNITRDTAIPFQ